MTGRDAFLSKVREALGRTERLDAPTSEPPYSIGHEDDLARRVEFVQRLVTRDADNLLSVLATSAESAGWNVARVASVDEAGDYILHVARDLEAMSAVYSLHPIVGAALRDDLFDGAGIGLTPVAIQPDSSDTEGRQRAALRSLMADADIGITGVDYAIAETGTCVIIPRTGVSRLVSLLPPVHIAVVERGQVLPSLDELFTLRRNDFVNGELGSYMNLITGPSRTADIEYTIVTGVHGPGEVHMVLVG